MKIQSITNVLSIHESITSLTHLMNHSYYHTWNTLLYVIKPPTYISVQFDLPIYPVKEKNVISSETSV